MKHYLFLFVLSFLLSPAFAGPEKSGPNAKKLSPLSPKVNFKTDQKGEAYESADDVKNRMMTQPNAANGIAPKNAEENRDCTSANGPGITPGDASYQHCRANRVFDEVKRAGGSPQFQQVKPR